MEHTAIRSRRLSWRSLFRTMVTATVLAVPASFAGVQVASAQVDLRVGRATAETFAFAPLHIGQELGIFEAHGLNITILDFGGGPRLMQSMTVDAVDIGVSSGPEMSSIVRGNPSKAVAMFMGPAAMQVMMARADGSVETAEDLQGRTVAVTQLGSLTAFLTQRLSIALGWGPDAINMVALGDRNTMLAGLTTHQVDAVVINTASALQLEAEGEGKIIARFGEIVNPFHNHVMYATDDLIANNPEALRAFILAWRETIEWMQENREETIAMHQNVQSLDTEVGLALYDEVMPAFSTDFRFDDEALAVLAASWVENGTLDELPDMSLLYTEEFLPQ